MNINLIYPVQEKKIYKLLRSLTKGEKRTKAKICINYGEEVFTMNPKKIITVSCQLYAINFNFG